MQFLGTDPYLRPETELSPVGKSRGNIDIDASRIHPTLELDRRGRIFRQDGLAVPRRILRNVVQSLLQAVHRFDGQDIVLKLRPETVLICRHEQILGILALQSHVRTRIGLELHVLLGQRGAQSRQIGQTRRVHDQAIQGIAHRHAPGLGVENDRRALLHIAVGRKIRMTYPGTRLDDRHVGIVAHIADQRSTPPGDEQIDIIGSREQLGRGLPVVGQQGNRILRHPATVQHFLDDRDDHRIGMHRIRTAFEDTSVRGLEAQGKHIETHIGTRLVDHPHYPERHAHLDDLHPIGTCPAGHLLPYGRAQGRHVADVVRYALDPRRGEHQAVVHRIGRILGRQIARVFLEDRRTLAFGFIGQSQKHLVDLFSVEQRQGP